LEKSLPLIRHRRIVVLSGSLDFGVGLGNLVLEDLALDESATLLKPLLGAQLGLELSDQWALGLRGDISGFNIGAAENLAWSIWAGARYRFAPSVALQLAYQYKDLDTGVGRASPNLALISLSMAFG